MFAGFPGGSKVDSGGTGGALELVLSVGGLLRVLPHDELDHEAQPVQEATRAAWSSSIYQAIIAQ